jgi:antitoxin component YwqK of YwqJK toxin-antitoxin module
MSGEPERHPEIPAEAVWVEEEDKWELCARDEAGAKHGECRLYRNDGTLYMRSQFVAGLREGDFVTYHPDGRVAREGRYENGELVGAVIATASEAEDGEPLRPCCVPDNAWQMRAQYERGQLLYQRFFDREGRALLSDGTVCPTPPPGLSERADFDESERRWVVSPAPGAADPLWRFYGQDGRLQEEARLDEGWKVLTRLFAEDGSIRQETHFNRSGRRHGPHRRRYLEGETSPYLDARIAEERGTYEDDDPVGRWTFFDRNGNLVRQAERGRPLPADGPAHPVFADQQRPPEAWSELAEALAADGQTAQAVCAAARAAAGRQNAEDLIAFIARHIVALVPAESTARAEQAAAAEIEPASALLTALVAGGDPAMVLRALATAQRDSPRAGCDFVEAALLLAPDRPMSYLTRALLRLELGDERGALADAARLQPVSEESARFVRDYARLLLPEWGFQPAREPPGSPQGPLEGFPEAPEQPLAAVRHTIQVYATRLRLLRAAVIERLGGRPPRWAPPDLSALLPAGPVELRRYSASITDETDDGAETVTVEIDETLDPVAAGLPALMRVARAQWAALTWLCWSCGLDQVVLPERLAPPPEFPVAAGAAIGRFFRAQDVLATGGLRSRTAGVPGFSWQGMEIDDMPRPFVQLAMEEYFELRALFLWLLSPENLSPFQSDLRDVA